MRRNKETDIDASLRHLSAMLWGVDQKLETLSQEARRVFVAITAEQLTRNPRSRTP